MGAVAVHPEVQPRVGGVHHGGLDGGVPAGGTLGEVIVQLAGGLAEADVVPVPVQAEGGPFPGAPEDGRLALEVLQGFQVLGGDGDVDAGALGPGGDGDFPRPQGRGRKEARFVNGPDIPLQGPGEGRRVRLEGQMLVCGGTVELDRRARGGAELRDNGVVGVPHRQAVRRGDGVDHGGALPAAALGGDGNVPALQGGGEDVPRQGAGGGGEVIALVHGDEVGVHGGGGDLRAAARQDIGVVGADVEVAQLPGGLVGGHQENLVGHGALHPVGGLVDPLRRGVRGLRDGQGGGAAAVQAQGRDAAQLDEPPGHLVHRRADGVAGLPAVDGVEDEAAVIALAHGGPGGRPGGKARGRGPVLHQGVEGPGGVLHVVPAGVGGGKGQCEHRPHGDGAEGVQGFLPRLCVGAEDHMGGPQGRWLLLRLGDALHL